MEVKNWWGRVIEITKLQTQLFLSLFIYYKLFSGGANKNRMVKIGVLPINK